MNRQDRARRHKRHMARVAAKMQRAKDRGHRTGGQANRPQILSPLSAAQRAARYGQPLSREGFAAMTPRQRRRMVHAEGHAVAAGRTP